MSKWKVILNKEIGKIDLEIFKTKKEAEESIKYRNTLMEHINSNSNLQYEIKEIK
jgi:hypothetical protein